MTTESHTRADIIRAALFMTGAIVSFSSMAVAGRAVDVELDTFELMLFRSIIGAFIVVIVAGVAGTLKEVNREQLGLHFTRNCFHFAGQNLWFAAVTMIPLTQLFALEFTSPIWVMILAPFLLGERMTRLRIGVALVAFVGVMIVTRPDFSNPNTGIIFGALSAIGFAGSMIFTKVLTRTQSITCILFWLTIMQTGLGLICAGWDGDIAIPSLAVLPWVVLVACAGLCAHFCLTTALRLAPAVVIVPVDFLRLPVIAVIGAMFYDEPLELLVFVGAALIFAANYINIAAESRKSAARAAA